MLKKIVEVLWKKSPQILRYKVIRITQKKFTVSVGAIISDKRGKILLLNHIFRSASGWGIPGGFIEPGEQPAAALKRELREETGLELRNIKMLQVRTIGTHIEILFRAEADGEAKSNNFEIKNAEWFELEEMPEEMDKVQKKQIKEFFY